MSSLPILLGLLLGACDNGSAKDSSCDLGCSTPGDSDAAGDSNESVPTDDSTEDSTPPNDSTPPDDSTPTDDSTPVDDSGDSDSGTAVTWDCTASTVTFERLDLSTEDVTAELLTGEYLTIDEPGRLMVCPGTWFARLVLEADIAVIGLGDTPADTVLSAGESGTILDFSGSGAEDGPEVVLTVSNLTLDRGAGLDVAHNSGGGGLFCDAYSTVFVEDVVFSNNFANDGAGLYAYDCDAHLSRVTFVDNESEDDGGAMTLWFSYETTLDDVVFEDNVGLDGGAMAMFYSNAVMTNVTFQGNTAGGYAGGLWLYNGELSITNSSFVDNVNTGIDGGALLTYGTTVLDGVTFTDNSAPRGGGLFVYYESVVDGTACNFSGNTPENIYAADYSEAGGVSYEAGMGYAFSCAENVCTGG